MTDYRTRLGLGACAAGLAVLAVAGCSGSGGSSSAGNAAPAPGSPIALVADAMNKATSAGSFKVTGTVDTPGGSKMSMNAQEQYSPSLEMSMSMQGNGQSMSEILIGHTVYMNYPVLAAMMGGKQWGEINLSQVKGSLGSLASVANSAQNENPTTIISALIATGEVAKAGTETVQGQQTTHYSGTLNVPRFLASGKAVPLTAAQSATLKTMLEAAGVNTMKVDLWVASDGLPVELKSAGQSELGPTGADLYMTDWGKPVQVGAPPSSEVFDMTAQINKSMK